MRAAALRLLFAPAAWRLPAKQLGVLAAVVLLAGCTCTSSNSHFNSNGTWIHPGFMERMPADGTASARVDGDPVEARFEDLPLDPRYLGIVDAGGFLGLDADQAGLLSLAYETGAVTATYTWHDGRLVVRLEAPRDDALVRRVTMEFFEALGWSEADTQAATDAVLADPRGRSEEAPWTYEAEVPIDDASALFQAHAAAGMEPPPPAFDRLADHGPWTWRLHVAQRIVEAGELRLRAGADGLLWAFWNGQGEAPSQDAFNQTVQDFVASLRLPAPEGAPREFYSDGFCSW